jgi:hypothetical protein
MNGTRLVIEGILVSVTVVVPLIGIVVCPAIKSTSNNSTDIAADEFIATRERYNLFDPVGASISG